MKNPKQRSERWLKQAEHDLSVAHANLAGGFQSDCCFMSEQTAQKAMNIPTRYPDALADPAVPFESYTQQQAAQALAFAQEILQFVKQKVSD